MRATRPSRTNAKGWKPKRRDARPHCDRRLAAASQWVEKNLGALLDLDLPGSTVVVGDGPARASLERRYPCVRFLGAKYGDDLADIYARADVFVFPSRTDTFGVVLIEAMASGLPVAAFPLPGRSMSSGRKLESSTKICARLVLRR